MKARIGELPAGTRFVTGFTGKFGTVRAQSPDLVGEVLVRFDKAPADKLLHPGVRVEIVGSSPEMAN